MKRFAMFNGKMKMADLILFKPGLILLLPRFNMPLGIGDKSVNTLCKEHGVSPEFFMLVCNIYSFDDYVPTIEEVLSTDMSPLIGYLEESHRYYLGKWLPHIAGHIERIAGQVKGTAGSVLKRYFTEYTKEVMAHFGYEEQYVFPHLEKLSHGQADKDYMISAYLPGHTNIEDKLDDLTQIMFKYLPEEVMAYETIGAVFDILQLSDDLKKHSLIEEKVLVPYVEHLERRVQE